MYDERVFRPPGFVPVGRVVEQLSVESYGRTGSLPNGSSDRTVTGKTSIASDGRVVGTPIVFSYGRLVGTLIVISEGGFAMNICLYIISCQTLNYVLFYILYICPLN